MLGFGRPGHILSISRASRLAQHPQALPAGSAGAVPPLPGCLPVTLKTFIRSLWTSRGRCRRGAGGKEGGRGNIPYLGLWCSPGQTLQPIGKHHPCPGRAKVCSLGSRTLQSPAPPCSFRAAKAYQPAGASPPAAGGEAGAQAATRPLPPWGQLWGQPLLPAEMGSRVSVDDSVRVVVVGGGFGGTAAAGLLKSRAIPFVLVDAREAFHHNVAALRAAVESGKGSADFHGLPPAWAPALSPPPVTAAAGGTPGVRRARGTENAASAPVMVKEWMFSLWKTNIWLWEDAQTICVKLIACPLGKLSKNYADGPFFFFISRL